MALWDYHVRGGPSFVGLSDERLAAARSKYPSGRTVESVHHLPRMAGDDETDHIMRHRYGIDPASYQGVLVPRSQSSAGARASRAVSKPRASKPRASKPRASKPRASKPVRTPKLTLSRLVRLAIDTSPSLVAQLSRLSSRHVQSGTRLTRHFFIGMPLVITTTPSGLRARFDNER